MPGAVVRPWDYKVDKTHTQISAFVALIFWWGTQATDKIIICCIIITAKEKKK